MRDLYSISTYTHIDGLSLILLARLFGVPLQRAHRNTLLDWIDDLLGMAEQESWRIYFLGGPPEMIERLDARLKAQFPRLRIGFHHGFDAFSPETTVWNEIKEFAPQVIFIGMGMPIQERWVLEARKRICTKLFIPCGATFEYLVQVQKPAPRWLGPIGLEWLYRLITRPRKLFRRYLIEPLVLLPMVLRELLKDRADAEK